MAFDKAEFARIIISELSRSRQGRAILKKYKQSEVREILEGYKLRINQERLIEISQLLYVKSPQYKKLIKYYSGMPTFAHVIVPIKDISSGKISANKIRKQYSEIGELLKIINLRHEMKKVMNTAFTEDVFYGYIFRSKKGFHIQKIDSKIAKITSIDTENSMFNYSINMSHFQKDETLLKSYSDEIQVKYRRWKLLKGKNPKIDDWVELDPENTMCVKANEEMLETVPPFAGVFDAIYDIDGFKQLRKDKEEIGNYRVVTQKLPMREDSEDNNDFLIDKEWFTYFHNMMADVVPDNVGVITSPMEIDALKFERDTVDSDGVAKAERDFWNGSGTSMFNADKSTSEGLRLGQKTDQQLVFDLLIQIENWLNRYLKFEYKDLMFNVSILNVTEFNRKDMFDMYSTGGQYGSPLKHHMNATLGLDPLDVLNMAYLENDILKLHEKFIPLASSHTMGNQDLGSNSGEDGRPKKDKDEISDETARSEDKPNA